MKRKEKSKKTKTQLLDFLKEQIQGLGDHLDLAEDLPKKWEKHGDMILFPQNCFTRPVWNDIDCDLLWNVVAEYFKVTRIAKKGRICDDGHRTPQVILLKGDDPWVCHVDNKIRYSYDVTRCMFSAGNITEKLRMAKLDCQDEVVVDMFAGIGYFTLPLLVHGKAKYVHACEWNSDAVSALKKNLADNEVENRCTVYEGDNREICLENVADRVIMGLIPSAMDSIEAACRCLKLGKDGTLHIHHNVESKIRGSNNDTNLQCSTTRKISCNKKEILPEWISWANETALIVEKSMHGVYAGRNFKVGDILTEILHIEKVKSYAPHIDHMVLDLKVIVTLPTS